MTEVIHKLKTVSRYFQAVERGEKTFEVRLNDRAFQKGDILELLEVDDGGYYLAVWPSEPKTIKKRVTYVLQGGQFGIEPRYCVLGLADVEGANP